MTIFGYRFTRLEDYRDRVVRLQHLVTSYSEFEIRANTGEHAITGYVDLPDREEKAVLEWAESSNTALSDILLLLSIFTGRDVFVVDSTSDDSSDDVIVADPRVYQWGGVLICSIPYKKQPIDHDLGYDIGFEEGLNQVYTLIRNEEWQCKYQRGFFLFLALQAFRRQSLEAAFIQCWTIWEHLFTVLNRSWLSSKQIRQLSSSEKIAFLLVEYALRDQIDDSARKRIRSLAEIRNRLVHFGRFPEHGSVHDDAVLFVRLTEFVIAKILGLSPSDVFNTMEKLEDFLANVKSGN
jgi:hypothetical protein